MHPQRKVQLDIKRAERLTWINWHTNRGRGAFNSGGREFRKAMRQRSWRHSH